MCSPRRFSLKTCASTMVALRHYDCRRHHVSITQQPVTRTSYCDMLCHRLVNFLVEFTPGRFSQPLLWNGITVRWFQILQYRDMLRLLQLCADFSMSSALSTERGDLKTSLWRAIHVGLALTLHIHVTGLTARTLFHYGRTMNGWLSIGEAVVVVMIPYAWIIEQISICRYCRVIFATSCLAHPIWWITMLTTSSVTDVVH